MYHNYGEITLAISNRRDFKGNSCYGYIDKERIYRIVSYATEIYNDKKGLNCQYYSPTTSKIQGMVARIIYNRTLKEMRKDEYYKKKEAFIA